ncbi:MAG: hypothetical protein ACRD3T_05220 [Terriglobia bacterium]
MEKSLRSIFTSVILFAGIVFGLPGPLAPFRAAQSKTAPAPATANQSQTSSLDFLGTYSAPNAVLATETGHTSAHPPSPSASQRLQQIESAVAVLPPWPEDLIWPVQTIEESCGGSGSTNPTPGAGPTQREQQLAQASAPRPPEMGLRLLSAADHSMQLKRFAGARLQYEEYLTLYPGCKPTHWNLAVVEAYLNAPQAALGLRQWLATAPSPESGKLLEGLLQIRASNPALAVQEIEEASNSRPPGRHSGSHRTQIWSRAVADQALGNLRQARAGLLLLLPAHLDSPEVWYALGSIALQDARKSSRTLSEIAPRSDWNRKLEAEALVSRYPELAREIWPENAPPGAARAKPAVAREAAGSNSLPSFSPAQALAQARSIAASLGHLEAEAVSDQSLYAKARQSLELANLAFDQAARSPGFEDQMDALRALAAEQEDDENQALAIYQQGLKQHPESAVLHAGLGELYWYHLELLQARQELEKAWQLDPSDPLVTYELGDTCQRLAEPRQAITLLDQALTVDPGLLIAHWSRAKSYLALGDFRHAAEDFKAAAPIDPTGEVEWQLSRVYERLGQPELARAAEKRAEALQQKQADAAPQR